MKKIFILDAVGYIFRSYYAIRPMTNLKGESTNAVYGFIRSLQKLQKDFSPEHIIAVFDGPDNKKSRTDIYEEYKSNREGMPEDLFPQLGKTKKFCELYGIPLLEKSGIEADDTIGAVAIWAEQNGYEVYICSSDKDLCQLVTDNVFILNTHKENLLIDSSKVKEIHGVRPNQIRDLLGIMGDTSDNIPGIPGFGPKTAAKFLNEYDSLENLIENAESLKGRKKELVIENKDLALLSKKLATLQLDVDIPKESTFYEIKDLQKDQLKSFYKEMNFISLLRDLDPVSQEKKLKPVKDTDYILINTLKDLKTLMTFLSLQSQVCVDTETTNIHPLKAELVGVGFAVEEGRAWYIPTNADLVIEDVISHLKPLLENPNVGFFGHNIKYDFHVFENYGITIKNICFDTMLASYLINSQSNRHGLDRLTLEKLGKVKIATKDLLGTGKNQITMLDVPLEDIKNYCCEDVDYTTRLKNLFEPDIKKLELSYVFQNIELPLIKVLADMETHGIYLHVEKLKEMSKYLYERIHSLSEEIYALAGESFNLNSPKQLGSILFEKLAIPPPGKKKTAGHSTSAAVLEALKHEYPICGKALEYRALEKLRSTYVDTLPEQVLSKTQKVHCTFNQSVAATGRLSCQDPNLQNIPIRTEEGRKIRTAFKPLKKDWSFLSADYSQIELRILAHLSQDPKLIEAFKNNEDIHSFTASLVFSIPQESVTKEMRHLAKAVNFGILYGQQAFGLSQQLGISMSEASKFIQTYFERYPKIKSFIEGCKEKAHKSELTTTFTGRRRPLVEINSKNHALRAAGERLAVNTPIQGGQADIIKLAMIEIHKKLLEDKSLGHMILQIHDELIFETPDNSLPRLRTLVKDTMENIIELSVPLIVDVSIGKNWSEC